MDSRKDVATCRHWASWLNRRLEELCDHTTVVCAVEVVVVAVLLCMTVAQVILALSMRQHAKKLHKAASIELPRDKSSWPEKQQLETV